MEAKKICLAVNFIVFISLLFYPLKAGHAASINYQYDNLNRLRLERYEDGKTRVYEYDEVGNRTTSYLFQFTPITQSGYAYPSGSMSIQESASRTIYFTPITHYHLYDVVVDGISKGAISSYNFGGAPAPQRIDAYFAIDRFPLFVNHYSYGPNASVGGTVTSSIPGINCPSDCAEMYDYGTSVTLRAVPVDAYNFWGWSGPCSGTDSCTLPMDSAKNVYAYFLIKSFNISTTTVRSSYFSPSSDPYAQWGSGGTITPSSSSVTYGGYQTFNIVPASGQKITNVMIDGKSMGAISSYTFFDVKASHSIVAQFYYNYYYPVPIYIYLNNYYWGSVTSPSGIYCGMSGTTCSTTVDYGTYVKLTATGNAGYGASISYGSCGYGYVQTVRVEETGLPIYSIECLTGAYSGQSFAATFWPLTYWPINSDAVGAGAVSPSPRTYFNTGSSKTFTISPSNGAAIVDVSVDGISVGPVTSYTFNNITTPHNITATFSCPNLPVRIAGTVPRYYPTLQAAYDDAATGATIQTVEGLIDNLFANKNISVTLTGGYDCNYISNAGKTTSMKGTITTTGGQVSMGNFTLF